MTPPRDDDRAAREDCARGLAAITRASHAMTPPEQATFPWGSAYRWQADRDAARRLFTVCPMHGEYEADVADSPCPACEDDLLPEVAP